MLNEFRNRQKYLDNCKKPPELASECDPFTFFEFEENNIKENIVKLLLCGVLFALATYVVFFYKYKSKNGKIYH